MRFLLFVSLWAHLTFIRAAPTDDLFSSGLNEPGPNQDLSSSWEDPNSWNLAFNSGFDQNSNHLADDSIYLADDSNLPIFGSANVASITDTSVADTSTFIPSDNLFGLDGPGDLTALQSSCGTEGSVSNNILTARDGALCSPAGGNQPEVPSLFQDPESAIEDAVKQKPQTPNEQQNPPPEKAPSPLDAIRGFFKGLGGDGIDCPANFPIRCCADVISDTISDSYLVDYRSCAPSMLPPFPPTRISGFTLLPP